MRTVQVVSLLTVMFTVLLDPVVDAEPTHLRRSLEREILKHTIHYLRSKLVRCLKHAPAVSRTKRRAPEEVREMTDYLVDMDVLQNTRDYLYARTLDCLGSLNSENSLQRAPPSRVKKKKDLVAGGLPTAAPPDRTTATGGRLWTDTLSPSPQGDTRQMFTIDGREVSCDSAITSADRTRLLCRNIWVDAQLRLPNWSVCPPRYDPTAWWHLNSIQSATFQVIDLESFCHALGGATNIQGYVTDVKVAWDCDRTKPRLKWLGGKWAGEVDDNGFLHDIECTYSPVGT